MEYENLILEKKNRIARIKLNRPEKLNALSSELLDELDDVCNHLDKDFDTDVVILTGSGRAFCSGFDISPKERHKPSATEQWYVTNASAERVNRMHWLRQPVIAEVNGFALAAGNVLAMTCDIVIAAESATFGEPEIRHVAHSPFTVLPYFIPTRHASWLYYTGETIDSKTAERFGMVNIVVPDDQVETVAWRAAETIAKVPPFAVQHMKRSINQTLDKMGWREAFQHHLVMRGWEGGVVGVPEKDELNEIRDRDGLKAFLAHRDGFHTGRQLYSKQA